MSDRRLHAGDIVQHFKRNMISEEDAKANMYLYKIVRNQGADGGIPGSLR